jgi:hypothetical protein
MYADNHLAKAGSTDIIPVSRAEAIPVQVQAETKVLRPAAEHRFKDLQPVGFGRISRVPQVVSRTASDWLILPGDLDPLYQQGQLAAPRNVRARIREFLNAGVWFDSIAIAHEVPPGAVGKVKHIDDLLQLLEPPMPKSLPVLSNVIGSLVDGVGRAEALVEQFLRKAADPVILGAVVANPPAKDGDAAYFFLVARWDY